MNDTNEIPEIYQPAKYGITLYTSGTPNGIKISMVLDTLGLSYKEITIPLRSSDQIQYTNWFKTHISITSKIPVLFDNGTKQQQQQQKNRIFESAVIIQYLLDNYDSSNYSISFPYKSPEYYSSLQWSLFAVAQIEKYQQPLTFHLNVDPIEKRSSDFISMYMPLLIRVYRVLDDHLSNSENVFIIGEKYSAVDILTFPWAIELSMFQINLDHDFPHIAQWAKRVYAHPEIQQVLKRTELRKDFREHLYKGLE